MERNSVEKIGLRIHFGAAFLKERLHHLVNNFLTSAPPREPNAEKTPLFSIEMKKAIKETHAEARRTRRVGEG